MWRLVTDLGLTNTRASRRVVAFIETPVFMPFNGKQSLMQSGFGFGVWTGIMSAMGAEIRTVHPKTWQAALGLSGKSNKERSLELAIAEYPSLAGELKRKKDHGRAEALLIARFGGQVLQFESSTMKSFDDPEIVASTFPIDVSQKNEVLGPKSAYDLTKDNLDDDVDDLCSGLQVLQCSNVRIEK
mmetsp:Transcript_15411/g.21254  ORF Transcript_15411/g.21254 Transcript_15411/m.21254 type:complete len:186 (+) Transcript_15411:1-558(+)